MLLGSKICCFPASWECNIPGEGIFKEDGKDLFTLALQLCHYHSCSLPGQCGHTLTRDRSKYKWIGIVLGLTTKGTSDLERCYHLSQIPARLVSMIQLLKKTYTLLKQHKETRFTIPGHPKWHKMP